MVMEQGARSLATTGGCVGVCAQTLPLALHIRAYRLDKFGVFACLVKLGKRQVVLQLPTPVASPAFVDRRLEKRQGFRVVAPNSLNPNIGESRPKPHDSRQPFDKGPRLVQQLLCSLVAAVKFQ